MILKDRGEFDEAAWGSDRFEPILEEIVDQSRWMTLYRYVFKEIESGRFYEFHQDHPSTENSGDTYIPKEGIKCTEVFPVEKTIKVYEPRKT